MSPGGTNKRTNDKQGKIVLLSLWAVGRLSFAIKSHKVQLTCERAGMRAMCPGPPDDPRPLNQEGYCHNDYSK